MCVQPLYKPTNFKKIKELAEDFSVDISWAVAKRIRFLNDLIQANDKDVEELEKDLKNYSDALHQTFITSQIGSLKEVNSRLLYEIKRLRIGETGKESELSESLINDEMIFRAKDAPITAVVDFDQNGKASAFCHEDRNPSLHFHRQANRAHCFPCNRSFNAVDILIYRDGYSFVQAVRELAA